MALGSLLEAGGWAIEKPASTWGGVAGTEAFTATAASALAANGAGEANAGWGEQFVAAEPRPTPPATKPMGKHRNSHRPSQGGTTKPTDAPPMPSVT